jgi:hypothetical protein
MGRGAFGHAPRAGVSTTQVVKAKATVDVTNSSLNAVR